MPDFVLCMIALSVALVCKRVLEARAADPRRQRRLVASLVPTPIGAARAGAPVKIVGTVERVGARRGGSLVVRDGSGAALVYAGAAVLVGGGAPPAAGDEVLVAGVARPFDVRLDDAEHASDGAALVFAGSEAQPLYLAREENLERRRRVV